MKSVSGLFDLRHRGACKLLSCTIQSVSFQYYLILSRGNIVCAGAGSSILKFPRLILALLEGTLLRTLL